MNSKFEYHVKDIPFLKKDVFFRFLFFVGFLALFVWQTSITLIESIHENFNIFMLIVSGIVLIASLFMMLISMLYAMKNLRTISIIRKRGKCVSVVPLIFNTKKHSYIKLFQFINAVITLASIAVLVSAVTLTILNISYSTSTFYLPLLFLVCLAGFNSVFHIKNEISTSQFVSAFNSIY